MSSPAFVVGSTDRLLIGGQQCLPATPVEPAEVVDPATGRVIGYAPVGGPVDVDRAVAAARDAGRHWGSSDPAFRADLLDRVAQRITDRIDDFAAVITAEMGAPVDNARDVQTQLAIDVFRSYATIAREFVWSEPLRAGVVRYEPIGVVAAITPWNYPLYLAAIKIAAALAAGCTVVFKPSQDAPLDAVLLVETIVEVAGDLGAPPGIVNLVTGSGSVVGEAISTHPGIAAVSFTGSTEAGRRVSAAASATVKRVGLELGGKSAAIILDDGVDLTTALSGALAGVFYNSGQTCTACARILVPRHRYEEAISIAAELAGGWEIGDPRLPGDHIGPIATRAQYETVRRYLQVGVDEGARLLCGGVPDEAALDDEMRDGYWVLPTVFAGVEPGMTIEREEIFGPVALVMAYDDDDDAVRIANDSIYGLSGAVWGTDTARMLAVAGRLETGRVVLNGGPFDVVAPTGGYKQSGNGRELGLHGLREYLEVKSVLFPGEQS
ncbi:aldehyde dehydrogenase family protein [Mycolicibacterium komossense]|uniref:aldehyde dehydrogenase (NAD(+)) n=1 Tax=Mycolicibacterium komossense TaxID=1779 RepID=A0ABT3CKN3_9MYCO|nr:aldehyde dehydrogenase family protein [Mycolicibacterium komossense]MCV7230061.1 aldehyde dehydrogenase family protein [Mycolicibacterium komossense]